MYESTSLCDGHELKVRWWRITFYRCVLVLYLSFVYLLVGGFDGIIFSIWLENLVFVICFISRCDEDFINFVVVVVVICNIYQNSCFNII